MTLAFLASVLTTKARYTLVLSSNIPCRRRGSSQLNIASYSAYMKGFHVRVEGARVGGWLSQPTILKGTNMEINATRKIFFPLKLFLIKPFLNLFAKCSLRVKKTFAIYIVSFVSSEKREF